MVVRAYSSQKRKVRNNTKKNKELITVVSATYLYDFNISIDFNSGVKRVVNFLPLFKKYVKGDFIKYFAPERFKKFIVKKGNIYWGKNEDIIFDVNTLIGINNHLENSNEKVLYVI